MEAGVGFMGRQGLNSYDPCESLPSGHSTMAWKAVKQLLVVVVIKVMHVKFGTLMLLLLGKNIHNQSTCLPQ